MARKHDSRRPDKRSVEGIIDAASLSVLKALSATPSADNVAVGQFLDAFKADLAQRLVDPRFGDYYPSRFYESFIDGTH